MICFFPLCFSCACVCVCVCGSSAWSCCSSFTMLRVNYECRLDLGVRATSSLAQRALKKLQSCRKQNINQPRQRPPAPCPTTSSCWWMMCVLKMYYSLPLANQHEDTHTHAHLAGNYLAKQAGANISYILSFLGLFRRSFWCHLKVACHQDNKSVWQWK